jgi:ATP/ADP translocase
MEKKLFLAQPLLPRFFVSDVKMPFFPKTLTIYWRRSFYSIVAKFSGIVVRCAFVTFPEDQLSKSNTEVSRRISKMYPENN